MLSKPFVLPAVLFVLAAISAAPQNPKHPTLDDYCAINATNTPCKYKCVRDDARCGPKNLYTYKHMPPGERNFVLRIHNELRNSLAGGKYKSFGYPPAANMMVLSWDKECEWLTACYILQCTWGHDDLKHPIGERYPQGQNLFRIKNEQDVNSLNYTFYNLSMQEWFVEYKDATGDRAAMVLSALKSDDGPLIGHFTQFAWATTTLVGCAKYKFFGEGFHQLLFFCNYFPAGNRLGKPMYEKGPPASKCPPNTKRNKKYPNLCGEVRAEKEDKYVPPIDFDPEGTKMERQLKKNKGEEEAAVMARVEGLRIWLGLFIGAVFATFLL